MDLLITSYNSHGHGCGRLEYIKKIIETNDIILWQEHWFQTKELLNLSNKLDIFVHGTSGMEDHKILVGRPFGGCAILWKRNTHLKIITVDINSKRICGIIIESENVRILLITVYMPCDISNDNNFQEFCDALSEIKTIIVGNNCDKVILGGDFNCNLNVHSKNVNMLKLFLEEENLLQCINYNLIDYTFESKVTFSKSTIDHFFLLH